MVQIVKYEITKSSICWTKLTIGSDKIGAQAYLNKLSTKNSHSYKLIRKCKNKLVYKAQINTNGDNKFLCFKILTTYKIPIDSKDLIQIQKEC